METLSVELSDHKDREEFIHSLRDENNASLLHYLTSRSVPVDIFIEFLDYLNEDDLSVTNNAGFTPTLTALRHGNLVCFEELLQRSESPAKQLNSCLLYTSPSPRDRG